MRMQRFPILVMLLVLPLADVRADQEQLSFRVNNLRQIEAVVSGIGGCGRFSVNGPDSIEIGSSVISINSLQGGQGGGGAARVPCRPGAV